MGDALPSCCAPEATAADPDPTMFVVPKNPEACLGGLPDELLLNITGRLSNDALAKMCRTSKFYKGITEAGLYECVPECVRYGILQELVGNTRLCKFIRKIEEIHPKRVNEPPILKEATNIKVLKVNLYRKILDLDGEDIMEQCLVIKLLNGSITIPVQPDTNTFAHLEKLELRLENLEIRHIAPVFSLPSLHTLVLVHFVGRETNEPWPLPKSTSNITTLKLDFCILETCIIVKILKSVKKLRSFLYQPIICDPLYEPPYDDTRLPHIMWAELAAGLRYHADSPTSFVLYESASVTKQRNPETGQRASLARCATSLYSRACVSRRNLSST